MDAQQYKEKKMDKLTRDVVQMVNRTASFGYGDMVDNVAKTALTNYLLTLVRLSESESVDIEILSDSLVEELTVLSLGIVSKVRTYHRDVENAS